MKITLVNYVDGEARFVIDEFPKLTFTVSLKDKTTKTQVTDALKLIIPKKDTTEKKYIDMDLKSLEGTDI